MKYLVTFFSLSIVFCSSFSMANESAEIVGRPPAGSSAAIFYIAPRSLEYFRIIKGLRAPDYKGSDIYSIQISTGRRTINVRELSLAEALSLKSVLENPSNRIELSCDEKVNVCKVEKIAVFTKK